MYRQKNWYGRLSSSQQILSPLVWLATTYTRSSPTSYECFPLSLVERPPRCPIHSPDRFLRHLPDGWDVPHDNIVQPSVCGVPKLWDNNFLPTHFPPPLLPRYRSRGHRKRCITPSPMYPRNVCPLILRYRTTPSKLLMWSPACTPDDTLAKRMHNYKQFLWQPITMTIQAQLHLPNTLNCWGFLILIL